MTGFETPQPAPADTLDGHLGVVFEEAGPQRVVLSLEVDERHLQPYGLSHGGIYCTLAETAASIGAALAAQERTGSDDAGAVGQSNHTDFLRPARKGDRVIATATPVHVGGSVQLWRVHMADGDDRTCATSTVRMFNVGVDRISSG